MQLTAMIFIVSSMGVFLSLLLNISTAEQQPESRDYSKRSAKQQVLSSGTSTAICTVGRVRGTTMHQHLAAMLLQSLPGRRQFCACLRSFRRAPQCSLQLLGASHLPLSTVCTG